MIENTNEAKKRLLDLLDQSKSPWHHRDLAKSLLPEGWQWLELGPSSFAYYRPGKKSLAEAGVRLAAGHIDSPGFRLKSLELNETDSGAFRSNSEVYGGPLYYTWLDRPLTLAGRVFVKNDKAVDEVLWQSPEGFGLIPSLAIHLDKEVNKQKGFSVQSDLQVLIPQADGSSYLEERIASELGAEILSAELTWLPSETASLNQDLLCSARIDNLASMWALIEAAAEAGQSDSAQMILGFDHEEIGSLTRDGAQSASLALELERLVAEENGSRKDYLACLKQSFLLSVDAAHARHPNQFDNYDPFVKVILGKGPCIKLSSRKSYISDAQGEAHWKLWCEKAGVNLQRYTNHSDQRGGTTLGPMTIRHLPIAAVDAGIGMWAMHSARESASFSDIDDLRKVISRFLVE